MAERLPQGAHLPAAPPAKDDSRRSAVGVVRDQRGRIRQGSAERLPGRPQRLHRGRHCGTDPAAPRGRPRRDRSPPHAERRGPQADRRRRGDLADAAVEVRRAPHHRPAARRELGVPPDLRRPGRRSRRW